jgi:hypothetical protein
MKGRFAAVTLPFVPVLLATAACATKPDDGGTPKQGVSDIDPAGYVASVQPVFERRCGQTTCHGQLPRGLRVYGTGALRLDAATGADDPTTPDEARATYASIHGLQPEKADALARKSPRTADDAYGLLVLTKPLAIERHRPGAELVKGEPAERCIVSWLVGTTAADVDTGSCAEGAMP